MVIRALITLGILLSLNRVIIAQDLLQAAFWNIENLFDTTDAPFTQDEDFTPLGRYAWDETRLSKKIQDISRVIQDLNSKQDLAILGLAEIENRMILDRLNNEGIKSGFNIIHKESPDERGIDCALLYDPRLLSLVNEQFIPVLLAGQEKTRDIIEAQFKPAGNGRYPTLYVFINHWPSRYGGQAETEPLRFAAGKTLRTRIDMILLTDPAADILIMGDFNDYPTDPALTSVLRARAEMSGAGPGDLFNTTWSLNQKDNAGTYVYRGEWGTLDQIIVSSGLLDNHGWTWSQLSTQAFAPDYLLESSGKYSGWPYRMYRGSTYQGGYSDHLPIVCKLNRLGT